MTDDNRTRTQKLMVAVKRGQERRKGPYSRYVDALCKRLDGEDANAEIQSAVFDCLTDYAQGRLQAFPQEVTAALAFAMRDVLAGVEPELFHPRKLRRGESPNPPTVQSCIEDAVRYVRYCRAGFIDDRSPCKTVAEKFSVGETTARSWCGKDKHPDIQSPIECRDEEEIRRVRKLMEFSGAHYQIAEGAASHSAITRRATRK